MQKYQTLRLNIVLYLSDYKKITSKILDVKIKERELVDKSDISEFTDNSDSDKKIATITTNPELKAEQDKIVKLQAFDSSFFRVKSDFEDGGAQNYLVFQQIFKYFKFIINSSSITKWTCKVLLKKVLQRLHQKIIFLQSNVLMIALKYK